MELIFLISYLYFLILIGRDEPVISVLPEGYGAFGVFSGQAVWWRSMRSSEARRAVFLREFYEG